MGEEGGEGGKVMCPVTAGTQEPKHLLIIPELSPGPELPVGRWGGWWWLKTSSSPGTPKTREVKEHSLGTLGNENAKASLSRARPAGRREANGLTSDIDQRHPDSPAAETRLFRIYGFPHHKRQILGEGSRNKVDIWSCTLGLLAQTS